MIEDDEDFFSTAWLEYFHRSDRCVQIEGVARAFDAKLTLRRSGRICVLNVGKAVLECREKIGVDIEIWLLGEADDPSHTGIFGYKDIETEPDTTEILARLVGIDDVYPVPQELL